jgi:hypothetical protein
MGQIKETTNEIILKAYKKFVSDGKISNFEYEVDQVSNANHFIQLRCPHRFKYCSIHYEFLFEKQQGGYSVELHAERIEIRKEMADVFKEIASIIKQINGRALVFYSRHRDYYGHAIKIPYGFEASPELPEMMAKDMRSFIEKTHFLVDDAVKRINSG